MPIKTVRGNQVVVPKVAPPVVPQVQQPERYSPNLARSLPTAGPAGQSILGQIGNVLTYPFTWAGQALMRGAEAIGLNPVAGPLGQAPAGVTGRYGPTTIGQSAVMTPAQFLMQEHSAQLRRTPTRSPRGTLFGPSQASVTFGKPPGYGGEKPPTLTIPGVPGFTDWTRYGGGGGGGGGTTGARYSEGLGLVNWRIEY